MDYLKLYLLCKTKPYATTEKVWLYPLRHWDGAEEAAITYNAWESCGATVWEAAFLLLGQGIDVNTRFQELSF